MKFSDLSSIKVHIIGINGIGMSALAIYLKNASMLFILIVVRLITDLIDAPLFYIYREPVLIGQIIIFTFLCYLPAVFGLRYLWKKINYK